MRKKWKKVVACVLTGAFVMNNVPWGTGAAKAETEKAAGSDSVYLIQTATGSDAAVASPSDAENPVGANSGAVPAVKKSRTVSEDGEYMFLAAEFQIPTGGELRDAKINGNQVTVYDMQPAESFTVTADSGFTPGFYEISLCADGYRTMYKVYADSVGSTLRRDGSAGFDIYTDTFENAVLYLEEGSVITVTAPGSNRNNEDKFNDLYGKVASLTLTPADEPDYEESEEVVLHSKDWYFGYIESNGYANLRPNDQIEYVIRREDGFGTEEAEYELTVQLGGGDSRDYSICINGEAVEGGALHYSGNGEWDSYSEVKLEPKLSLKTGDVLAISAKEKYGMVGGLVFTKIAKEEPEGHYVYEAEDYYTGEDGNETDGAVKYSNMQPGETIEIPVGPDFVAGNYRVSLRSNGTRTGYRIYVNGKPAGIVNRRGQEVGWDAASLTDDEYAGVLSLTADDTITIEAPMDKVEGDDPYLYGKLDSMTLTPAEEEPVTPEVKNAITLESRDWYFGAIRDDNGYTNFRENDSVTYFILAEDGFSEEKTAYTLTAQIGGFSQDYQLTVNDDEPMTLSYISNNGKWGDSRDISLAEAISLKAGDVLTIKNSTYGMLGNLTFTKTEEEKGFEDSDGATGIHAEADAGVVEEGARLVVKTVSEDEGLQAALEDKGIDVNKGTYYDIYLEAQNGDKIQPKGGSVTIRIPLPDGYQKNQIAVFHLSGDGTFRWITDYQVSGTSRQTVEFKAASFSIFGIVDRSEAVVDPTPEGFYAYEAENYYSGNIESGGGVTYIDMQPGDTIEIPVSDQPMEAGNYRLTLRSNGDRNGYRIYVNGKPAGIVNRRGQAVGWGAADLTEDEYDGVLSLKPGDVITIEAPTNTVEKGDGNGPLYGKLDSMLLRLTGEEPENPGLKDTVVLKSEDWYLGGTDGNGGVNLRSDDQIDFFIRTEEGFAEEENIYQLKARLGGFRTEYTVKVNGAVIGTITRDATDWGVFTESGFGKNLILKAGDILSICASDSWGTVGDITLTRTEEPAVNPLVYEAEDFYENKDGIQHEGNVQYCDVQPGEAVTFTMMAELTAGYYRVSAVSNGTRMAYMVSVNGTPRGVIKRTATGWNAADLTTDPYDEILWLEPGDTVTLTASVNKDESDSQTFGKLDKLVLETAGKPETPEAKDRITLRAENWYGGTKDSSGGMNIRPDDSLDLVIREQDGFVDGEYSITAKSGGFRSGYTVKVNGTTVTELSVRTCEWGLYLSSTASVRVHLKPGDILSFCGADSWGCIDAVIFQKDGTPANTSMADRRGGHIPVPYYAKSEGAKASGEAPTFIFQGEGYYQKQSDNPAADLQPGQQIEIPLSDNPNFVDGVYQVTVVSCGGRDHMFVKVNGLKTGRIDRHPGAYGMDKMTQDKLPETVTLCKGDLLCIEAAPTEWGWVDYIQLDLIQKAETVTDRKSYEFKAMNFYGKKQKDTDTADLQPGERIEIPVAADGFEAGYYLVSATACGDRKKMSVEVNGEEMGWIQRNGNSYGIEAMVRDTMPVPVYLKPGDTLSICAPANGGWGWVEKVTLIKITDGMDNGQ